jgi:Xaa-Pro aminopeptidase
VEQLAQHEADVLAITLPDNIAWLLNVRGSDLAMVPVPFSFALLHRSGELEWFVDSNKTQQLPVSLLNTLTLAPQRVSGTLPATGQWETLPGR